MTDVVTISPGRTSDALETSRTFTASGHVDGWVVANNDVLISDIVGEVATGPYNAFAASTSTSSYTVTIDTGEALVKGAALVRDVTTDVTLASSTTGQTVYLGWAYNAQDTVKIGLDADFNADDPRIPIWTFDTDGSGVSASTDERQIGAQLNIKNTRYEGGGVKVDAAKNVDTAANAEKLGSALPSSYLRSDQNDTIDGRFYVNNHAFGGTPDIALAVGDTDTGLNSDTDGLLEFYANLVETGNVDKNRWYFDILSIHNGGIDVTGHTIRNFRIDPVSSRPSSPSRGQIIYRTDKE